MGSYGVAKGRKTCACRMRKVRILEVRGRRFVNARARIFRYPYGSIQQKHSAPSARSIVAHTAPCTSVLCSGTLHLLQDSIAAPAAPTPWNRRLTKAEFFKIWKWEGVYPLLHVRRSAPRHSAVAPCTLYRIHRCTFSHVYRRTQLFRAAALNTKFFSQRARRSRSRPFAQKDFLFGWKAFGQKMSGDIIRPEVFSCG